MNKRIVIVAHIKCKKIHRHNRESFEGVLASPERNQKFLAARAEEDPEKRKKLKEELPCICWNADDFTDGQRHDESAVQGPFYMSDYDLKDNPHMGDPREYFEKHIKPHAEKLHLVWCEASISKGLHTVCVQPQNASVAQAQQWQASIIGLTHDKACKDISRLAIAAHKDEIFHSDMDIIFGEKEIPTYTIAIEGETATASQAPILITQEKIDEVRAKEFLGLTLGEIKDELSMETHGTEKAPEGKRNNSIYADSHQLMALGLDTETLVILYSDSGLSQEELRNACRTAPNYVPSDGKLPGRLRRVIHRLREEKGLETGRGLLECRPMPKLVPLFRELAIAAPKGFVAPLIFLALPILGALATKVRVRYLDGVIHSLAFMAHVVGKMAGGKSTIIKWLTELLLKNIREQDAIGRELEREYAEASRRCKSDEKKPKEPKPIIREVPFTISVASLLKRLAQAQGMHLISVTDEIDTVRKTNKAGAWSEKTDIYRHGFDNGEYGQDYLSENSFSGIYKVMYNTVSGGTAESTKKFFGPHVLDGLVTRVAFTHTPDDFASEMPCLKELTPKQQAIITQGIQTLEEAEGEIRIPRTAKAIKEWLAEKRKLAMESMSLAIDAFYKRAGVMGYRAAVITYILNDYKETTHVIDFGLWVADYVLQQQVAMWGAYIENAEQMETSTPVANLYNDLGEEFCRKDLVNLRIINGQGTNVRTIIMRWKQAGMIREVEKNKYVKTTPQVQA